MKAQGECKTCRYFHVEASECRRHAPQASSTVDPGAAYWAFWPETTRHDWCGEWESNVAFVQKSEEGNIPMSHWGYRMDVEPPLDTTPSKPADSPQED